MKPTRTLIALTLAGVATISSVGMAAASSSPKSVNACADSKGNLSLLIKGKCAKGTSKVSIGTVGPVGPAGPAGKNGTNGVNGTPGANGTNGTNGKDGTNGTNGINATALFVTADGGAANDTGAPTIIAESGVVSVTRAGATDQGRYEVQFSRNVIGCAPIASISANNSAGTPGYALAENAIASDPTTIFVRTTSTSGSDTNFPFSLAVFC